jgi:hypothetical protein
LLTATTLHGTGVSAEAPTPVDRDTTAWDWSKR